MGRHLIQILIAVAICGIYSIFFLTKEAVLPNNYALISNLVSFFFILAFIVEIKSNHFLNKRHFKAF